MPGWLQYALKTLKLGIKCSLSAQASKRHRDCMMKTLHITNGDSTVELLKEGRVQGDCLPWRDILHMGPVPACSSLAELSAIRAKYIASTGWGEETAILQSFQQRDAMLASVMDYEQVILWFEHDLYDQLQILQLLDYLGEHASSHPNLTLINPGVHLGYHTPTQAVALLETRRPINPQQFELASHAWQSFCQPNPQQWAALLQQETSALPYLHNAVLRGCEEFPDARSGLNKTEQSILELVAQGHQQRGPLFRAYCAHETDQFHGDLSFFWLLDQLIHDSPSLISDSDKGLQLTPEGHKCNMSHQRWQRHYNASHWFGGCEISAAKGWFWNTADRMFTDL